MTQVNRRSALSVGLAAMAAFVAAASAYAQRQLPPGISLQAWGKRESMIPGYKTVSMRDLVYQPGAKTSNPSMPNDMVCHVPEGELRVKQPDGMEFVAKKGDIWTCKKGRPRPGKCRLNRGDHACHRSVTRMNRRGS